MLGMSCHRCGSEDLNVAADAMEWDEIRCRDCGEFISTYGAATQPLLLADACLKTRQLAQTMGISLSG